MYKGIILILIVLLSSVYVVSGGVVGCQAWQGNNLILVDCNTLGPRTVCTDGGGNPIYKNGLPVLCTGGGRDIPPPPKPKLKPVIPDDPVDPIAGGAKKRAVACPYSCSEWTPQECRGGYQERSCNCLCATCTGDKANRRLCPISVNGFPNIPQPGSYLYVDREGIYTKGEYHAYFINFYLGETEGNLYLINDGGQHIQGIGLHVGEPDAFIHINTILPSWIRGYNEIDQDYTLRVLGDVAETTVTKTETGFEVGFDVNQYMPIGQQEFSLEVMDGERAVQTIPLYADVQPAKETYLDVKEAPKAFLGYLILFGLLIGLVTWLILRKKVKKKITVWGKTSFIFSVLSIFFLGTPLFGLALGLIAVKLSRNQKNIMKTKLGTTGFVIGLIGVFLNLLRLFVL